MKAVILLSILALGFGGTAAYAIHGKGDAQITEEEVREAISNSIHGKGD